MAESWDRLKKSFSILWDNHDMLWIGICAEILFFLAWGFFAVPLREMIEINLVYIGDAVVTESSSLGRGLLSAISGTSDFRRLMILVGILSAITYVLYCLFHGFIWRFCFNLDGKKEKYLPYIKRFFLVNILWYALFMAYVFFDFILSYTSMLAERFGGASMLPNALPFIFLIVIGYFAIISYVMAAKNGAWKSVRESFKIGFRKGLWLVPAYAVILIVFAAVNYLLMIIGMAVSFLGANVAYVIMVIIGVLVVMPLMLWARVFAKEMVGAL